MYLPTSLFFVAIALLTLPWFPFQQRVGRSVEAINPHPNHSASAETDNAESLGPAPENQAGGKSSEESEPPANVTVYGRVFCAKLVEIPSSPPPNSTARRGGLMRRWRRYAPEDLYNAHGYGSYGGGNGVRSEQEFGHMGMTDEWKQAAESMHDQYVPQPIYSQAPAGYQAAAGVSSVNPYAAPPAPHPVQHHQPTGTAGGWQQQNSASAVRPVFHAGHPHSVHHQHHQPLTRAVQQQQQQIPPPSPNMFQPPASTMSNPQPIPPPGPQQTHNTMPTFVQQAGAFSPTTESEKMQWMGSQIPEDDDPFIANGAGLTRNKHGFRSEVPENAQPFDRHAERLGEILLGEPQKRAWAPANLRRYRRNSLQASPGRKSSDYIIQLVPASNAEVSIYRRKNRPFEVPQLVKEVQTDENGYFEFVMSDEDFHELHPFLVVSHKCAPVELRKAYRSANNQPPKSSYIDYFPINSVDGPHGDSVWKMLVVGVEDWEQYV